MDSSTTSTQVPNLNNPTVKIVEHTEAHPEDNAMLQALYSRSPATVDDHIEKVKAAGSGKFMSQFYLGYGHASIADCGFITVYIENVSMLAAKAIQDELLYNGQECSSRYIDWSNQPFFNPVLEYVTGNDDDAGMVESITESTDLLKAFRDFYISQKPVLIEHLKTKYPIKENEKSGIYEKAITAKAFDILRGYLPCGATTSLSWTTSLRKANEHLRYLSTHPLKEIRDVSGRVHDVLLKKYPNSIAPLPKASEAIPYNTQINNYYDITVPLDDFEYGPVASYLVEEETEFQFLYPSTINSRFLKAVGSDRPKYSPMTKHELAYRTRILVSSTIDFGSYRDLQRHRGGYCAVPIIFAENGFHPWYYNELPPASKDAADELFEKVNTFAKKYGQDSESMLELQYFLPMGTLVQIFLDYDLKQAVYVAEIRSGQTVHATLRPIAQLMAEKITDKTSIPVYADMEEDAWTLRRGTQDIVPKVV